MAESSQHVRKPGAGGKSAGDSNAVMERKRPVDPDAGLPFLYLSENNRVTGVWRFFNMVNNNRKLRFYIRLGCFILAILLLLPFPFWIKSSRIFVQTSSFVTICTILAGWTIWTGSILGLGFAIICLTKKRFFCRYICPVGLLLDTASGMKLPAKIWWKGCPPIGR